jgi:prophage regulatory protein
MSNPIVPAAGALLTLRQVRERTGLSRSSVYDWSRAGKFPAPVRLSPRAIRWHADQVSAWIAALPTASKAAGAQ